jgi:hypothetical protein
MENYSGLNKIQVAISCFIFEHVYNLMFNYEVIDYWYNTNLFQNN